MSIEEQRQQGLASMEMLKDRLDAGTREHVARLNSIKALNDEFREDVKDGIARNRKLEDDFTNRLNTIIDRETLRQQQRDDRDLVRQQQIEDRDAARQNEQSLHSRQRLEQLQDRFALQEEKLKDQERQRAEDQAKYQRNVKLQQLAIGGTLLTSIAAPIALSYLTSDYKRKKRS